MNARYESPEACPTTPGSPPPLEAMPKRLVDAMSSIVRQGGETPGERREKRRSRPTRGGLKMATRTFLDKDQLIKRKVYPKEGTRVRTPGMYHITTWYGEVGD